MIIIRREGEEWCSLVCMSWGAELLNAALSINDKTVNLEYKKSYKFDINLDRS